MKHTKIHSLVTALTGLELNHQSAAGTPGARAFTGFIIPVLWLLIITRPMASALTVSFFDTNDIVTVVTDPVAGGTFVNGEFAQWTNTFHGFNPSNLSTQVLAAVLLQEGPFDTNISDIVEVTLNIQSSLGFWNADMRVQFTSEADGGPPLAFSGPASLLAEDGSLQDLTTIFKNRINNQTMPGFWETYVPSDFNIKVMSDVEVPEPGTMSLVTLGILPLMYRVRRRVTGLLSRTPVAK